MESIINIEPHKPLALLVYKSKIYSDGLSIVPAKIKITDSMFNDHEIWLLLNVKGICETKNGDKILFHAYKKELEDGNTRFITFSINSFIIEHESKKYEVLSVQQSDVACKKGKMYSRKGNCRSRSKTKAHQMEYKIKAINL